MTLWLLICLLLAGAALFVSYPFIVERGSVADSGTNNANIAIFREQKQQLALQLETGQITQKHYEQRLIDAQNLLLRNTSGETIDAEGFIGSRSTMGIWLLPVLLVVIPLATVLIYQRLGASADQEIAYLMELNARQQAYSSDSTAVREQLHRALQQRVKQRPDNVYYWALLAQQAIQTDDRQAASNYYAEAIKVAPDDGSLQAQYAESLFILADSQFTQAVIEALDRAFSLDASNPTVLGMKGIQAFENQQWQRAVSYWQGAMQRLDKNAVAARALQNGIEQARGKLALSKAAEGSAIELKVWLDIDAKIASTADQTVFIAVVRASGSPMPLAARKLRVGDLPSMVRFTDADALIDGQYLSSVTAVRVIARLSQSGFATPQPGDWQVSSDIIQLDSLRERIVLRIADRAEAR